MALSETNSAHIEGLAEKGHSEKDFDTLHNDEAIMVGGDHGDDAWSPEEEKRLLRKIDRRLLVLLFFSYGLQYYDKAGFTVDDDSDESIVQDDDTNWKHNGAAVSSASVSITDREPAEATLPLPNKIPQGHGSNFSGLGL